MCVQSSRQTASLFADLLSQLQPQIRPLLTLLWFGIGTNTFVVLLTCPFRITTTFMFYADTYAFKIVQIYFTIKIIRTILHSITKKTFRLCNRIINVPITTIVRQTNFHGFLWYFNPNICELIISFYYETC